MTSQAMEEMTPDRALQLLQQGNARYLAGNTGSELGDLAASRAAVAGGQRPFAVILGCADSRVPPRIGGIHTLRAARSRRTHARRARGRDRLVPPRH